MQLTPLCLGFVSDWIAKVGQNSKADAPQASSDFFPSVFLSFLLRQEKRWESPSSFSQPRFHSFEENFTRNETGLNKATLNTTQNNAKKRDAHAYTQRTQNASFLFWPEWVWIDPKTLRNKFQVQTSKLRPHSHRTRSTLQHTQANYGTHCSKWECSHRLQATSKGLQANLYANLLTPPVWTGPKGFGCFGWSKIEVTVVPDEFKIFLKNFSWLL